jgi:hypothetical protein
MSSQICGICCNHTFGREVVCQFCQNKNENYTTVTCTECVKRYILDEMTEAKCMICKREWPTSFIYTTFTKSFLHGPYRKHLMKVWVERETSMIPSTIPYVQAHQQLTSLNDDIAKSRHKIEVLEKQIRELRTDILNLENKKVEVTIFLNNQTDKDEKSVKVDLLMPCPKDQCNGLIEKTTQECVVCQTKLCSSCLDVIDFKSIEQHQCDPTKVLTAVDINKNTKPCPKCATRIYKIEGCDMMFCTNCKVSFSWQRGNFLTGPIHNPHYFEWQQKLAESNRQLNTTNNLPNCGEIPDYIQHFFSPFSSIVTDYGKYCETYTYVRELLRSVTHYRNVEIPWYIRETTTNNQLQMRHLRILYILGKINKDAFNKSILLYERKRQKAVIIRDIMESFTNILVDYLHLISHYLVAEASTEERNDDKTLAVISKLMGYFREIDLLRENANDSIRNECSLLGFTSCPSLNLKGLESYRISNKRKIMNNN